MIGQTPQQPLQAQPVQQMPNNRDNMFWVHPETGNLITPKVMLSFANLAVPQKVKVNGVEQGDPIHGATLMIPATADMSEYIRVWQEACAAAIQPGGKFPPGKFNPATGQQEPFFDMTDPLKVVAADAKYQEELFRQFTYFIKVRTYGAGGGPAPGILLPTGQPLTDPNEVYSGRWAVCSVQAFPYNNTGNYGIGFSVQNVQLMEHDERLGGGRAAATTEFATRSDVVVGMAPPAEAPPAPAMPTQVPGQQSMAQPAPVQQPMQPPMQQPMAQPAPVQQPMQPPMQQPMQPPMQQPMAQPAPMQQPMQPPMQQPMAQPAPMQQPMIQPAPMQQPMQPPMQQPMAQPAPMQQPMQPPMQQPMAQPMAQPAPVQQPAQPVPAQPGMPPAVPGQQMVNPMHAAAAQAQAPMGQILNDEIPF